MNPFEGKVALITGGNAGIGRATAIGFARLAAKVVISGRRENEGHQVVEEIKASGGDAIFVKTDVSKERDVAAMVRQTVATFGRLDFAFNNAGISGGDSTPPTVDYGLDLWQKVININLSGVYYCLRAQIPAMLKNGGGAIVNTSSGAAVTASRGQPGYTAAKYGVLGLTKLAAQETAVTGVRVNAILPGMTRTPLFGSWAAEHPDHAEALAATVPVGRMASPAEVAEAAVWLCSSRASYVNGLSLVIDGGLSIR